MSSKSVFYKYAALAVAMVAFAAFFGKSYESTIPATDTGTYADLSLNATQNGFIPHFPIGAEKLGGHWGEKGFNDAPFLVMSLSGKVMRYFGPSTWSARFVSCLFSVLCVALLMLYGARVRTPLVGILAALILLFSRDFLGDGLNSHLDNPMTFFIIASFIAWSSSFSWTAGIMAGIGVWFKNPVALLIVPAAVMSTLLEGKLREEFPRLLKLILAAVFTGSLIWIVTGIYGGWELVQDYWVRQVWGTAIGGRGMSDARDLFLIVKILKSRWMPWTILFLAGVLLAIAQGRIRARSFLLPLMGSLTLIGVVSLMRFKYSHYFVPAYPFMALIAAEPLGMVVRYFEEKFYQGLLVVSLLLITFLLCAPIPLSPESFPAIKKFTALIQSYGDCKDTVLFVEGGQPYGNYGDYKPEIEFYTGRQTILAECGKLSDKIEQTHAAWIMLTRDSLENCVRPEVREKFSRSFQLGNQFLLSRVVPASEVIDLTPLERELRAQVDCKAAPLPNDRYHSY